MKYLKLFENFDDLYMINESNIEFSPSFLKVLSKMSYPLSKQIIELSGKDENIITNYFDVNIEKENDIITFISDKKAKEIESKFTDEWKIINNERYLNNTEGNGKYYQLFGIELPKELKIPPNGSIGKVEQKWISPSSGKTWVKFVTKDHDPIIFNIEGLESVDKVPDVFYNQNRQSTRIGRAIRSLLTACKIKFTDKDIEEFVNKWKSTIDVINDGFSNFDVVSGDQISKWYNVNHYYDDESGSLAGSCMRDVDDDFFDIYCDNEEVVSLVILKTDDGRKIKGRAILWTMDSGQKLMDRVYTNYDSDDGVFKEFAKRNGWYSKKMNNNSSNLLCYDPEGNVVDLGIVKVQLSKSKFEYYPYMDTLKYLNPKSKIISNSPFKGEDCYELQSTDGEYEDLSEGGVFIEFYNGYYSEDELTYCEYADTSGGRIVDGYRLSGDYTWSERYQVNIADSFIDDHMKYCILSDTYVLEKDAIGILNNKSDYVSEYVDRDLIETPKVNKSYVHSVRYDALIPIDKAIKVWIIDDKSQFDWRFKDDDTWEEKDGEFYEKSEYVH